MEITVFMRVGRLVFRDGSHTSGVPDDPVGAVADMDVAAAVRAVFEEGWNQERFETLEPLFGETFALHIGDTDRMTNVCELREIVRRWQAGFPDLRFEIHAAVASGDRAAVHATLWGHTTARGVISLRPGDRSRWSTCSSSAWRTIGSSRFGGCSTGTRSVVN